MIKDYKLTLSNLPDLIKAILPAVNEGKSLRVDIKIWKDKRSLKSKCIPAHNIPGDKQASNIWRGL